MAHRILAQQFGYAVMADRGFFFATIRPLQYEAFTRLTSFLWVDVHFCVKLPVAVYLFQGLSRSALYARHHSLQTVVISSSVACRVALNYRYSLSLLSPLAANPHLHSSNASEHHVFANVSMKFWSNLSMPCFGLRFLVTFPSAFYWAYATNHYKVINDNVELHNGTYDTTIPTGEQLAHKWGTILFIWNLIVWWPSIVFRPPLNLPLTMVDTAITVFMSKATHYQIGYTPQNLKACHDPVGLELQRPPGTNESFFAAAGRLNETVASPTKMCVEFVREMQLGIACCFFYALLSFLGYISTFVSARQMRKNNESILGLAKDMSIMTGQCLFWPVKWGALVVGWIMFYTPILFFRCLPLSFKAPVRSGRRCVVKTAIGAGQKVEIMLSEVKNGFTKSEDVVEPYWNSYGAHTPLAHFLGVYDMLVMVTEHLHYTDLISLSTVSKSVRQAVLPSNEISRRLAMFRLYTCEPDRKNSCWSCTNQICDSCEMKFPVPESVASRHIENCVPYCASCYRMYNFRRPRAQRDRLKGNPPCKCNRSSQGETFLGRLFKKDAPYTKPISSFSIDRQVCRNCSQFTKDELLLRKAEDAVAMLKKGLKGNGEKWNRCANLGCCRSLGTGPRYWICKRYGCDNECSSTIHRAWGSKASDSMLGEASV